MKRKTMTMVLMTILLGWCTVFALIPNVMAVDIWDRISSRQSDLMYKYNSSFYADHTKYWNTMSTINQSHYSTMSDLTYQYSSSYTDPARYSNPMSTINQRYYPRMSDLTYKYTIPSTNLSRYWNPTSTINQNHYRTMSDLTYKYRSSYTDPTKYWNPMSTINQRYYPRISDLTYRYTMSATRHIEYRNPMSTINQRYYSNMSDPTYKYIMPTKNIRYTMPSDLTLKYMDMLPPSSSKRYSLPPLNQNYIYLQTPMISQRHSLVPAYQDFKPIVTPPNRPSRSDCYEIFWGTYAPSLVSSYVQDITTQNAMSLSPGPQLIGRGLIYAGAALTLGDFLHTMYRYSQIGQGNWSYRELLSDPLVGHTARAVYELGGGYRPLNELVIHTAAGSTFDGFQQVEWSFSKTIEINRAPTLPGPIGKQFTFGFSPIDSYSKTIVEREWHRSISGRSHFLQETQMPTNTFSSKYYSVSMNNIMTLPSEYQSPIRVPILSDVAEFFGNRWDRPYHVWQKGCLELVDSHSS